MQKRSSIANAPMPIQEIQPCALRDYKKILKQQNTHSETPISVMKRRLITAVVTPLGTFEEQTLEAFKYTTTGSRQDLVVGGINGWSQHNPINRITCIGIPRHTTTKPGTARSVRLPRKCTSLIFRTLMLSWPIKSKRIKNSN
ncbi:hypothetical protein IscW_ISCW006037 [Ixodes scapularis]|uniref:Uncharacterized protein n=1 Tax=Ixodes scapularis TaxID=6945 RepID=B7PNS4_IXOSC|nr:hypothetical protein IscW_ISCW006037 [Ixodes scapularis]|eukprot:XP_002435416.1 hypothetical protein IscW_ISCW006037 [Ixodes scapularis]